MRWDGWMRASATDRLSALRRRPEPAPDDPVPDDIAALARAHHWTVHGRCERTGGWRLRAGRGERIVALPHRIEDLARLRSLASLDASQLTEVVEVVDAPPVVLVREPEAIGLDELLRARGELSASEVAGVGHDLGLALASVHAAGLVHGPLGARDVLVTSDGSVRLRVRVSEPESHTAPDDVADLARLLRGLGDLPEALARIVADGQDPVPWSRPEARVLADRCAAASAVSPLRVPDPAALAAVLSVPAADAALSAGEEVSAGPIPRRRDRRPRRPRRGIVLAAGLGGLGLLVGVGALVGHVDTGADVDAVAAAPADPEPTEHAPEASAGLPGAQAEPEEAATALTLARLAALGGTGELAAVTVPGSPAAEADRALAARLENQGTVLVGLTGTVREVELIESTADASGTETARTRVTYEVSAHEQVTDGARQGIEAREQEDVLVLVRDDTGWRVREIE